MEQTQQYMHERGTDRLLANIKRAPDPTRAQIERAKQQAREIARRLGERAKAALQ